MDALPLVSIVMCAYNGEKYLDEQIDSLVNQTYRNIEIIIVDDVSTDATVAIVNKWIKTDRRITLHQNPVNLGYNRNFEKAISFARGEFVALCDQDDIWMPRKIQSLLSCFDNEEIILAHARSVKFIDEELHYPQGKQLPLFSGNDPKKLIYDNQIGGHRVMFRKSLISKISPIPPNMFYDWWIGVLAASYGTIKGYDDYLVKYRIHAANAHINVKKEIRNKHIDHITAWRYFATIEGMKGNDKDFLNQAIAVFERHRNKNRLFDYRLFFYLLKNRDIFFANRRKLKHDFLNLKFMFYYAITKF